MALVAGQRFREDTYDTSVTVSRWDGVRFVATYKVRGQRALGGLATDGTRSSLDGAAVQSAPGQVHDAGRARTVVRGRWTHYADAPVTRCCGGGGGGGDGGGGGGGGAGERSPNLPAGVFEMTFDAGSGTAAGWCVRRSKP